MFNETYFTLQSLISSKSLPAFPSFLPSTCLTQEILQKYKELYNFYILKLSIVDEMDINEFIPFIYDFIGMPIYCKEIEIIAEMLKDEEPISGELFSDEKTVDKPVVISDFKTAKGESIISEPNQVQNINNQTNINKESGLDQNIIDRIKHEILDSTPTLTFDDIAGLTSTKKIIQEIVVWPLLRPDIFKGLRNPPKGLLLFGPPGTGKTMIGKCIASQCKATFFSISASSLTSKWVGEGEKMVRALFYLARKMQPSVVFIDEIDSLLNKRTENENEGSRRIKTEFLVQFDGAGTDNEDKILIIGATNLPHEIDEAARRRLVKRIYVPLPDKDSRRAILQNLMKDYENILHEKDFDYLSEILEGYSGSDIYNLAREAVMQPLREVEDLEKLEKEEMRKVKIEDFIIAMGQIRKSVGGEDLEGYEKWNQKFGSI